MKLSGKIRVTMKSPDAAYYAANDFIGDNLHDVDDLILDVHRKTINRVIQKFIKYGEYLTVEIDLEKETCEVVPV